ncbi:MAG: hypothetical protein A2534_01845 [Candidatus Magasanikbacteria bacterium RIFOXYD2_FULL_39_9]|uniref:Uncharacterized protein n=1 Tax=Candidatus Magasanikbacteria bacterium RIFOXYD1_FULL_40_23 TaxID=1798705 RepID=A0A1F6P7S4_9BACT|nr:MAG: hypothetical protein A2563_00105 [Candidatus Magasanikbacteria bacterium RIFOXYD1_FULL_40_23]OGH93474.1 MAG: hypothetical protein A2534_01845 [Candidatus Magasanikbacteria bacterium RIFOXYD2_FULL_39_9]
MSKPKMPTFYRGKYGLWRLIYILIFGVLLSAVLFTYYFIYQNIYSAIANANAVTSIKSNLNIYNLDIPAFEKAAAAINKKQIREEFPPNIRNIFFYSSNSVATPTSTST